MFTVSAVFRLIEKQTVIRFRETTTDSRHQSVIKNSSQLTNEWNSIRQ